jgi:tRNA-dihydrouridine synthase C
LSVPIIANGEIWSLADFKKCQTDTQSEGFMIGRGAIANPFLALEISRNQEPASCWRDKKEIVLKYHAHACTVTSENFAVARSKQMLKFFDEKQVFENLKTLRGSAFLLALQSS